MHILLVIMNSLSKNHLAYFFPFFRDAYFASTVQVICQLRIKNSVICRKLVVLKVFYVAVFYLFTFSLPISFTFFRKNVVYDYS